MSTQWKPSWTPEQIRKASLKVEAILRKKLLLKKDEDKCGINTILAQLYKSEQEIVACRKLDIANKRLRLQKDDVIRVLGRIRDHWKTFCQKVESTRGKKKLEEIIGIAQLDPASLWLLLYQELLQKPWKKSSPFLEANSSTAWYKIGSDCQFVWPYKFFKDLR